MSSAAAIATPSTDDVLREIRTYSPTMKLFRGHDQWFRFEFGGRDYWFPPDVGGKLIAHPFLKDKETGEPLKVPGDGILQIKDVYGRQQEKISRKFTGALGQLEDQTVGAILLFAITNYADKGVVWLLGNDTDEARKKASRAAVRNHMRAWAEQQVEARSGFVTNFKNLPKNQGKRVPPPKEDQRRAQRYLDSLAEEGSEGYEYVCEHGCSDFDNFEDYARHMKVNHSKVVTQQTAEAEPKVSTSPLGDDPPAAGKGKKKR